MNAKCHRCQRAYLTARGRAGELIKCRSCGALNDAAGGPAPDLKDGVEVPAAARRAGAPISGASFVVGPAPKPVDPEVLVRHAVAAKEAELRSLHSPTRRPEPASSGSPNRAILMIGAVFAATAMIVLGGLFAIRVLKLPVGDGLDDWRATQLAVPQLVTKESVGSGFITERGGRLWLVTNYHVIEGASEVDVLFRDPKSGAQMVPLRSIPTESFRVHPRFLEVLEASDEGRTFDLAACDIEVFRPMLAAAGIRPLTVLDSASVASGARVMALGHPGSKAFQLGSDGDAAATGVAPHSMFEGILSSRRAASGKPTLLQTTAAFASGCSGGPLVLAASGAVVGVNTWSERSNSGESKEGMRFSLAADQVFDVIDGKKALSDVRREIERGVRIALPQPGETDELNGWACFPDLDADIRDLIEDGWKLVSKSILVTEPQGVSRERHTVRAADGAHVLVVALPRDRSIDVDLLRIVTSSGMVLGSETAGEAGAVELAPLAAPNDDELAVLPAGMELEIDVGTFYLGRSLPARLALLVLEHSASEPNALNDAAPPAEGGGGRTPPPANGGIAAAVKLDASYCNESVYASSLLGMSEFDQKWLALRAQSVNGGLQPLFDAMVPALSRQEEEGLDDIGRALRVATRFGLELSRDAFAKTRPVLNLLIEGVPEVAKVAVYMKADPHGPIALVPTDRELLVSASDHETPHLAQVDLRFPWDSDALRRLAGPVDLPFELRVRFEDGSESRVRHRIRVLPSCDLEQQYPCGLAWAALVDPQHPYVRRIIDQINQSPEARRHGQMLVGAGGDQSDQLASVFMIWRELSRRGLRYQNLSGTSTNGAQRVRAVHESLCARNANCADGSVLFASFLEAIGLETAIVLVPGHAFVVVRLDETAVFIETTRIGQSVPSDPSTEYDELFRELASRSPYFAGQDLHNFEQACQEGSNRIGGAGQSAIDLLAEWERLPRQSSSASPPSAPLSPEHERVRAALADALQLVRVREARSLGVRPIGAPSDLESSFPLPR